MNYTREDMEAAWNDGAATAWHSLGSQLHPTAPSGKTFDWLGTKNLGNPYAPDTVIIKGFTKPIRAVSVVRFFSEWRVNITKAEHIFCDFETIVLPDLGSVLQYLLEQNIEPTPEEYKKLMHIRQSGKVREG